MQAEDVACVVDHVRQHPDYVQHKTLVVLAPSEGSSAAVAAAAATSCRVQTVGWLVSSSPGEKWKPGDGYVVSVFGEHVAFFVGVRSASVAMPTCAGAVVSPCLTG